MLKLYGKPLVQQKRNLSTNNTKQHNVNFAGNKGTTKGQDIIENREDYTYHTLITDKTGLILLTRSIHRDPGQFFEDEGDFKKAAQYYNASGKHYCNSKEYPKALQSYNKAIELTEKHNNKGYEALAIYSKNAAETHDNLKEYDEAAIKYNKAAGYYEKLLKIKNAASCYNSSCLSYYQSEKYSEALEEVNSAVTLTNKHFPDDCKNLANYYEVKANVYEKLELEQAAAEQYNKAALNYGKVAEQFEKQKKYEKAAAQYHSSGLCYFEAKKYPESVKAYNNALTLTQKHNFRAYDKLAAYNSNAAAADYKTGSYKEAGIKYDKAASYYKLQNKNKAASSNYMHSSVSYNKNQEYRKAIVQLNKAISLTSPNDNKNLAQYNSQLASTYDKAGRFNIAAKTYDKAAGYYEKQQEYTEAAFCYNSAGLSYFDAKKYSEAQKANYKTIDLLKTHDSDNSKDLAVCYIDLASAQLKLGNYNEAALSDDQAARYYEKQGKYREAIYSYNNSAESYLKDSNAQKALKQLNKAKNLIKAHYANEAEFLNFFTEKIREKAETIELADFSKINATSTTN